MRSSKGTWTSCRSQPVTSTPRPGGPANTAVRGSRAPRSSPSARSAGAQQQAAPRLADLGNKPPETAQFPGGPRHDEGAAPVARRAQEPGERVADGTVRKQLGVVDEQGHRSAGQRGQQSLESRRAAVARPSRTAATPAAALQASRGERPGGDGHHRAAPVERGCGRITTRALLRPERGGPATKKRRPDLGQLDHRAASRSPPTPTRATAGCGRSAGSTRPGRGASASSSGQSDVGGQGRDRLRAGRLGHGRRRGRARPSARAAQGRHLGRTRPGPRRAGPPAPRRRCGPRRPVRWGCAPGRCRGLSPATE